MFNRYPYTNFHELNLDYFIQHFNEIFTEWEQLYNELQSWKTDTTEELDQWRADVEKDLDDREAALRAELEIWKQDTADDISEWETATLNALTAWQTATQAVFEAIRVEAASSASAADASAGDAAEAKTAAETAQAAAEAAAQSVQASAAQIQQNADDIDELKTQLKKTTGNSIIEFESGSINTSGSTTDYTVTPSTIYRHAIVDCYGGSKFTINGQGTITPTGTQRLWAFVDGNGNILSKAVGDINVTDLVITAPPNAVKLVLNLRTDTLCYTGEYIKDNVFENTKRIDDLLFSFTDATLFEAGNIAAGSGENSDDASTNRFRTKAMLPENIIAVKIENGYMARVMAYSGSEYIGEWNGQALAKYHTVWLYEYISFKDIGNYSFRVVVAKYDNSEVTSTDYTSAILYALVDNTLTDKNVPADAKAVGDIIQSIENELNNQLITGWTTGYIDLKNAQVDITHINPSQNFRCVVVACKFNDTFMITGEGAATAQLWGFIDNNGDILTNAGGATVEDKLIIKAPRNAVYLVINDRTNSDSYKVDTISFKIAGQESLTKNHLNILIYGNSYAADSWGYVPFILKKYGITVNIYLYYRGSGSIRRLVAEWDDDTDTGKDIYGYSHTRTMTHIDTRYNTKWDAVDNNIHPSPHQMLLFPNDPTKNVDKWDIITLQGVSSEQYSDGEGGYTRAPGLEPYFRQAINLIHESYFKPFNLGFFGTYNRIRPTGGISSEEMDDRIETLMSDEAVWQTESFNFILPVGAAVFSGRTNTDLASKVISDIGNLWAPDYIHLQEGVPCYLAACTVCQALFNKFFPQFTIMNDQTRITADTVLAWKVPMQNGTVKTIETNEELYYQLAQKCAIAANNNPFDITPIYSPTDTTPIVYNRAKYAANDMINTSDIDPS